MRLRREKVIELHRELWDWLYHNPDKGKEDWPKWDFNGGEHEKVKSNCFLCEYTGDSYGPTVDDCLSSCPLEWPGGTCTFNSTSEIIPLYDAWSDARSLKLRTKLAKKIRDLPERRPRK